MSTQRKQYSAEFKACVALEALKGLKTVNELASTYGGAPDADCALETSAPKGDARDFLGTSGQARTRPGGAASPAVSTNRTTEGGVGLGEKKSWTGLLTPSGS